MRERGFLHDGRWKSRHFSVGALFIRVKVLGDPKIRFLSFETSCLVS